MLDHSFLTETWSTASGSQWRWRRVLARDGLFRQWRYEHIPSTACPHGEVGASPYLIFVAIDFWTLRVDKAATGRTSWILDGEVEPTCTKIYYASRTHSQLAQIIPEMRRLKLKPRVSSLHPSAVTSDARLQISQKRAVDELEDSDEDAPGSCARTVSLGSRKQLCINDELHVKSRDLDESCRELLNGTGTPWFWHRVYMSAVWQRKGTSDVNSFRLTTTRRGFLIFGTKY